MLEMADELSKTIATLQRMYGIMQELTATTHDLVDKTHGLVSRVGSDFTV
jgi:RND superfamily putative drug exporter